MTVLTEAMASRRGEAHLRMTQSPGMSSLLDPDPGVTNRFYLGPKLCELAADAAMQPQLSKAERAEPQNLADLLSPSLRDKKRIEQATP